MKTTDLRKRGWLLVALLAIFLALTGCNGSSDPTAEDGEVVIGLTDAEGDFLSYTVDVLNLRLTHDSGAVVDTLPLNTRVDFAQYTDMTEFLTAATVPRGVYVKAEMTLDFSGAEIWVQNAAGEAVQVVGDKIVDEQGNPLGELVMAVQLEGRDSLFIAPGIPAHLTLDFDLNTSNRVDFASGEPVVTVQPVLLADVELDRPKIHRVRGPLADVDPGNAYFEVIIRPFVHLLSEDRRFGTLRVDTRDDTVFEIDGTSYQGVEGLEALAAIPSLTATVAIGDLKGDPRRFEAREVYAGSSVPNGNQDAIRGSVIARSGTDLTVRGATLIRADGSVVFRDTLTVTLDEQTLVKKQLSTSDHTIDEISVGQRVQVFGTLDENGDVLAADHLRLLVTRLFGTRVAANGESAAPLLLDLQSIDAREVSLFDFSGTGQTPTDDADPQRYEIATGTLDLSPIATDAPVVVGGFVTPFGSAPADFEAQSVVDLTNVPAVLTVGYGAGTANAFKVLAADGITLDLTDAGDFHHLGRGRVTTDLTTLSLDTTIVPHDDDEGTFWIDNGVTRQLHTRFANFTADLAERIETNGALVKGILATGSYLDSGSQLTTRMIIVKLL